MLKISDLLCYYEGKMTLINLFDTKILFHSLMMPHHSFFENQPLQMHHKSMHGNTLREAKCLRWKMSMFNVFCSLNKEKENAT